MSSSWVDTSLINSCKDKEFSIVRYFSLHLYKEPSLQTHHSQYISLTLPLWTCQRIIQYTIQSSRVLSAPATTSLSLSSGHKSLPPGVCMQSQSPETSMLFLCCYCPCFDTACMLVAQDKSSVRRKKN